MATQNPDPAPVIHSATLRISQNYADPGQSNDTNIGAAPAIGNAAGIGYTAQPAFAANVGFGPGVSVAVDNTLGAFSPYQNRVYVAYTDQLNNTSQLSNIRVKYGDFDAAAGRVVWSGKNTLVGPGFMPKLSVDPTTGTLVLAYYSALPDAANARSSMMVTTAVNAWDDLIPFGAGPGDGIRQLAEEDNVYGNTADGRIEFAPSVSVNAKEVYFDQIRSELLEFESIPSNQTAMGPEGFGNNVGLAVYNGRITLLYAGNLNTTANQIRTQNMTVAAGPRVVNGDMGAVLEKAVTPIKQTVYDFFGTPSIQINPDFDEQYNATFGPDGRRQFDGFVVEFDRPVDPATFDVDDISIKFRSPTDDPVTGGTDIFATEIIQLDTIEESVSGRTIGSKRFLVKLPPQSEVGTYSYVIGADVGERIRGRNFEFVNQPAQTQTFNSSGPALIADADGINPGFGFSFLSIPPGTFPANQVIGDLRVHVNISHLDLSQLKLELYSFDTDQTILLVNDGELPQGENYGTFVNGLPDEYTIFDDNAPNTLANDVAPYLATYRPAEQLQQLSTNLLSQSTNWFLIVTDTVQGHSGVIQDWKLEVTPAVLTVTNVNNNFHDQDSDGREGEIDQDLFAVPNPVNGTPFILPYASGSLPVVITGPRIVKTEVQGQFTSEKGETDILVKNGVASFIDVQFDRTINEATFKPEDVLAITGPLGPIQLNGVKVTPITGLGGATTTGNSRFFRVEFAQQKLSGYYRIQLGSNIADTFGNLLDSDMDAGVANLKGASVARRSRRGPTAAISTSRSPRTRRRR